MRLEKVPNGGFIMVNEFGRFFFQNVLKFYKFQILCEHPTSRWHSGEESWDKMCDRCGLILDSKEQPNNMVGDL